MFWAFKLSFDVDILVFLVHFLQKLGEILFSFLVTLLLVFTNMTKIFFRNFDKDISHDM